MKNSVNRLEAHQEASALGPMQISETVREATYAGSTGWMGAPVGLPEHAPLARLLGEGVRDDGARAAPRRLMLASVFG